MSESLEEARARAERTNPVKHLEPICDMSCGFKGAPHRHGFPCYKECEACHGVCHPDCPAYKE